jgi:prepilin-type N-terminal cleavage/methylation domain-containing protein
MKSFFRCPIAHEDESARTQTWKFAGAGRPPKMKKKIQKQLAGMTLTELVCVIAILTILGSMYVGAIVRAFTRVVKFLKGF